MMLVCEIFKFMSHKRFEQLVESSVRMRQSLNSLCYLLCGNVRITRGVQAFLLLRQTVGQQWADGPFFILRGCLMNAVFPIQVAMSVATFQLHCAVLNIKIIM